jgi:hypothetical protein
MTPGEGDRRPDLNAARLRTGTFRYRTLIDGKDAGQGRIEIRKAAGGTYVFSNFITGTFSQSWESVALRDFTPVSAKLTFGEGAEARPAFDLAYRDGRVSGFATVRKSQPPERRTIDDAFVPDTVDQRIDWAAVMSLGNYRPGAESQFHVYDPNTGNSLVTVRTGQPETARVPGGIFKCIRVAYRIDKRQGSEEYQVCVSNRIPRMMIKEIFPNGAETELVEVKP